MNENKGKGNVQSGYGFLSYDDGFEAGVDEAELFDWSLFGAVVRNKRRRLGCASARDFSRMIYNRTRINISHETLLKIESGKQTVSAMQYMGILMALGWSPNPGEFFRLCACEEWHEVEQGSVPYQWRVENTASYSLTYCGSDAGTAFEVNDAMQKAGRWSARVEDEVTWQEEIRALQAAHGLEVDF